MLSPRLTNCPECSNIPSLLKKIDCKLAELGNNLYNNISYMLNKPIPAGDITQLIAYRRILTHKYCNPNYLHKYSVAMIASRVIRLTAGCVSRCNTLEPCLEIPCDITIVPNPTTTSTSTISPTTTTTSSSSTSTTTSTTIAPTTTTTTTPPSLILTFDDIANADILVAGDANNVTDWNTFFDLPTYGTPFTSVSISGNIVSLIGATDITIKTELFYYNNGSESSVLEIVDISGVITTLEIDAFLDCYGLSYVVLNGVITAQDGVFNSCSGINFLILPLLETAGDFCFYNVSNLTTINLPQLTTVGNQCFYNCTSLTTVILPQLMTTGDYCFYNCIGLITIDLSSCINLGGTVGDDNVFLNISGNTITLTIPTALMTCNSGSPDGDIQYLQAYNTVTIITT